MSTLLFLLKFLSVLLVVGIDAQYQSSRTDCRAEGQVGTCIVARDCQMVADILQQSRDQAIAYLRRNHCGFQGRDPLVCCIGGVSVNPTLNYQNPVDPMNPRNPVNPGNQVNTGNPVNPGNSMNPENPLSRDPQPNEDLQKIDVLNHPLLPSNCGRDLTQKIVGGERTDLDEFPWMTLLEYQKPNGRSTLCGGVLISKRYVLTAAHCLKGKDLPKTYLLSSVRLGEYNTDTEQDCVQDDVNTVVCADDPITVGIEEQIAHESYQPLSPDQRYDIALLRLSYDVRFTNYIKPICLPSNSSIGGKLFVAGWGRTENRASSNVKLKLSLPLTEKSQCVQTYSNAGVQLGQGQICAGGQKGKDSCRGDSGGPLMAIERLPDGNGRWTSVGVVSFGPSPCGLQGWPGVYTKVADFVPWILSKMRP